MAKFLSSSGGLTTSFLTGPEVLTLPSTSVFLEARKGDLGQLMAINIPAGTEYETEDAIEIWLLENLFNEKVIRTG